MSSSWHGPLGPVTLHSEYGLPKQFATIDEAAEFIRLRRLNMSEIELGSPFLGPYSVGLIGRHVLVDHLGLIVPLWRIQEAVLSLPPRRLFGWMIDTYDKERDYRKRPVAGTGSRRWRCYRKVKTQQERRTLSGLTCDLPEPEDFPIRVKIRKCRQNLPTTWDDTMKGRRGDGWKAYRSNQYRS